ncbi:hypothetical protein BJ508DRAFT_307073 [Ascobolus immersus RN42]|uniref:Uncharacterized protein n=1 Tax=Ascobolus immersus RN42 TaxID=1160509 RepID=A0A3N4IGT5_ASCIM|nr:hypothetical protein BJ508DRAFT_307073 [Ascobolus immersus RN42]
MKPSFAALVALLPLLTFGAEIVKTTPLPTDSKWGLGAFGGKVEMIPYASRFIPDDIEVKSSKDLVNETLDEAESILNEGTTIKPVDLTEVSEEDQEEEPEEKEEEPVTVTSTSTVYVTTTVSRTHGPIEAEATPAPAPVRRSASARGHKHQAKRRHQHGARAKRFVTVRKQ